MIRSPFNFVRLSQRVFFPKWAKQISHDVPFFDWFNGVISLKITAESPVFVRNGHTKEDADQKYNPAYANNPYNSFSEVSGRYFIPGTSIKGAVRNVLGIMSNGKIRVDKSLKFAQREWRNSDLYPLKGLQGNFLCGWLKWDKDTGYYIENHGKPCRIAHTRLDEYFEKQGLPHENLFRSKFSVASQFNLNSELVYNGNIYDPKTAVYKYALVNGVKLSDLNFDVDEDYANSHHARVKVVEEESNHSFKGCIVFTGQPNQWIYPRPKQLSPSAGKFYDFVFKSTTNQPRKLIISDEDFRKYESIYEEHCDWLYWKSEIYTTGIPVFFRLQNDKLKDWGLAFLYKLPYSKTPFESLPKEHQSDEFDLADCIFGTVNKDCSLKGRVSFGHAFCEQENPRVCRNGVRLVLSSPKASYYPIYIQQRGENGTVRRYKTYNDGELAGWKRYPIRSNVWETATGSNLLDTVLYPLEAGASFVSKVRFFNLNTFELGALLSALTYHHNEDTAYYQLGQGKPYGYGKVKIQIGFETLEGRFMDFLNVADRDNLAKILMGYYEYKLSLERFSLKDSLSKLLPMVSCQVSGNDYEYMVMSNDGANNEFLQQKEKKAYLQPFSENHSARFQSLYSEYSSIIEDLDRQISDLYGNQKAAREAQKVQAEQLRLDEEARRLEEIRIAEMQLRKQVDALIQDGSRFEQQQDYRQAREKYSEAYLIMQTPQIEELIGRCNNNLQRQQQPIDKYIFNSITSIPAYVNPINKWLKFNNRELSDKEKQTIIDYVLSEYAKLDKKTKKKWKGSLKELNKLLGENISCHFEE